MVALVTSVLTSATALTLAKVSQSSIHSVKATQLAIQSEQYALGQAAILKATNYDDLTAQSRQVIQNSNGYESEITLSGETEISTGVNQRFATVRVYRTGEALPRATLVVPKTDVEVQASGGGVPVGTIIAWASTTAPTEGGTWLLCNGQSCSAYPKLVALIGNTVPSLSGRFLEGTTGTPRTTKEAGLPNITGTWGVDSNASGGYSGAVYQYGSLKGASGGSNNNHKARFDASRSSAVYGKSTTVQPASYLVRYYIKAA